MTHLLFLRTFLIRTCSKNPVVIWPFVDILTLMILSLLLGYLVKSGIFLNSAEDKLIRYIFMLWNSHLKWKSGEEVVSNSFTEMKWCKWNVPFYWFKDVSLYNFHTSCPRPKMFLGHIEGHKMNQTWGFGSKEVLGCRWNSWFSSLWKLFHCHPCFRYFLGYYTIFSGHCMLRVALDQGR